MKLIGVIIKVDYRSKFNLHPKKISINLSLPYSDLYTDESKQCIKKLLKMDKEMSIKYTNNITETFEEDINCIKTYKPFYYDKKKDIIVTFNVPNALSNVRGLSKLVAGNMYGLMVKINADAKFYNFTDKDDNKKKIRGWNFKLKCLEHLKID